MAIAPNEWLEIEALLSASGADRAVITELRQRFPQLSWTRCDASDVTDVPFRLYPRFEIHLVDRSDHCVQITADPARATGIVVAERNLSS